MSSKCSHLFGVVFVASGRIMVCEAADAAGCELEVTPHLRGFRRPWRFTKMNASS